MNSVLDTDAVLIRIDIIEQNVSALKKIAGIPFSEFQEDPLIFPASERMLQVAIEACLDIGSHIISAIGARRPKDYADIIKILAEEKILTDEYANKIMRMAGFRNRLVHLYLDVDIGEVYRIIQENLDDFAEFVKQVKGFVSEYAKE